MSITKLDDCISPSFYDLHKELKKNKLTEYWLRGGRGCFHGEQKIRTANGPMNIKDIEKGTEVYTLNENTYQIELKPVAEVFTYENVKDTYEVKLKNGETIIATGDHKFLRVGGCATLKEM